MIICFVGERGAGKDTAADALRLHDFQKLAHADGVREVVKTVFGITDNEMSDRFLKEQPLGRGPWGSRTVRWFMLQVGTEAFRDTFNKVVDDPEDPNSSIWVQRLWRLAEGLRRVVVPDCRFWDEYHAAKQRGAIFVRIDSPRVKRYEGDHRSEIEWREFPVDHVLINDYDSPEAFEVVVLEWYSNLRPHA